MSYKAPQFKVELRLQSTRMDLEKVTPNIGQDKYNTDKQSLKKIPDVNGLLTATVFNAKFDERENKMSDTSGISKLVKKA